MANEGTEPGASGRKGKIDKSILFAIVFATSFSLTTIFLGQFLNIEQSVSDDKVSLQYTDNLNEKHRLQQLINMNTVRMDYYRYSFIMFSIPTVVSIISGFILARVEETSVLFSYAVWGLIICGIFTALFILIAYVIGVNKGIAFLINRFNRL